MPLARRMVALALTVALLAAGLAIVTGPAFAQDPPNQGKANAAAGKKKAAPRRKPRGNGAVGVIVPYPLPPVLIIRQTPEAHDEIRALLDMLRYY